MASHRLASAMAMQTAAGPPHLRSGPLVVEKGVGVLARPLQVGGPRSRVVRRLAAVPLCPQ